MRSLILSFLWLSGCAAQAVRCDAHLRPINAPAGKVASEVVAEHVNAEQRKQSGAP
jgi:hypothetical protein